MHNKHSSEMAGEIMLYAVEYIMFIYLCWRKTSQIIYFWGIASCINIHVFCKINCPKKRSLQKEDTAFTSQAGI